MFLFFYNVLLYLLSPFILLVMLYRVLIGKEDKLRYFEKFGFSNKKRIFKRKVIWFHACSVGEVKSIFNLTKEFSKEKYSILITTNTLLSSIYVKKNFSSKVIHQFLPLDFKFSTMKFLEHWKPDIGIFIESELWPNLIKNCINRNIPLVLLQASFSKNSLRKWSYFKFYFKNIMSSFKLIIAQSEKEKKKLFEFADIKVDSTYNLKNSSKTLSVDQKEIERIKKNLNNYFFITALSTHLGEEKILLNAFKSLVKKIKKVVLVIQPRHPNRAESIKNLINENGFHTRCRSKKEYPDKETLVYLADTFGESGTMISLANMVILGGTLTPVGGHNIIEPAQLAKCIIVGKHCSKIQNTINLFKKYKAVKQIKKTGELPRLIYKLYLNKTEIENTGNNAYSVTKRFPNKEKSIINQIISLLKNENSKILVQK